MHKFIKSFNDKKFKYGSYSTITAIIVISILIIINLVVSQLDFKFDLTSTDRYSITDKTKEFISSLKKDVKIYALFKTGNEDNTVVEVLEQYAENSKNIKIEYKDPYIYPQFTQNYKTENEEILTGSLIVESGNKYKIVNADELYLYNYDYSSNDYSSALNVEPSVTSAIQYVTMENLPTIYCVSGHNEDGISNSLKEKLEFSNYNIKNINLISEEIPDDCTAIMITSPTIDYSQQEAEKIKNYLSKDGRVMALLNYTSDDMPNLNSIINAYGVESNKAIIVEGDASYCISNDPTRILPKFEEHEINSSLIEKGYRVLVPIAQGFREMELKKNGLVIEPLLTTSKSSYGKTNSQSTSINKEENDLDGPFNIAVAITDSYYTDTQHTSKLVVLGSSYMLIDSFDAYVNNTNSSFVLNALNWLNDENNSIYIAPKNLNPERLMIDAAQAGRIIFISCAVIPAALFAAGFIVWIKRRNK